MRPSTDIRRPGTDANRTRRNALALRLRLRALLALAALLVCFGAVAAQLVRLGLEGGPRARIATAKAPPGPPGVPGTPGVSPGASSAWTTWARPDIVDRHGRLMATDRAVSSLFADPLVVQDIDEAVEKLTTVLPGLNEAELRRALADRGRRFVWVARGLQPEEARAVHELGLPGLGFRTELKRTYPLGALAGHVLGAVNVDNRGLAGIERLLDDNGLVDAVRATERSARPPVRLALDIGVQHAVAEELRRALKQYGAAAAAAVIVDAATGEIVAAVSLPEVDPTARPSCSTRRCSTG